jgi:phosphatidylglycerol:prolipoprotein diacylglycerol transferase
MIPYFAIRDIPLGSVTIQIWGLFVAVGFVAALIVSIFEARRKGVEEEIIWDVMTLALIGMIVGGRLAYFIISAQKNLAALADMHAGFSLVGGLALSALLGTIFLKYKKQNIRKVLDILVPGTVIALILTRVGCFLVGDHIGKITSLPWAMGFADGSFRHPVALYHIVFLLAIFFIIGRNRSKGNADGYIFYYFCVLYAALGFLADFSRCSDLSFCDAHFIGLTATQWILFAFLISLPWTKKYFYIEHSE